MSEKNGGGPAFPGKASINRNDGELQPFQFGNNDFETLGMTLRDYFAARAMDHALSHFPCEIWNQSQGDLSGTEYLDGAARSAYAIADAMLRAREA
jgi:hypothetical protein